VMEACGVTRDAARVALEGAGGSVKLAIVMVRGGVGEAEAARRLEQADGVVRRVVGDPPPVAGAPGA